MYNEETPVFKPILGAVIGSIPGMILWTIAGYFGITWALLGLLIVAGTLIGYEKMGGSVVSLAGLITCAAVILITVYLGAHLSWSMLLHKAYAEAGYDNSTIDCIFYLHHFLDIAELKGDFIRSLLTDYLFAGIGAWGLFRRTVGR